MKTCWFYGRFALPVTMVLSCELSATLKAMDHVLYPANIPKCFIRFGQLHSYLNLKDSKHKIELGSTLSECSIFTFTFICKSVEILTIWEDGFSKPLEARTFCAQAGVKWSALYLFYVIRKFYCYAFCR